MKRIIVLNFIKHKDVVYGINRFNKKYVDLKSDKKSTLEGITEIVNNNQNLYMKRKENEFYISFKDFEIFINIDNNDKYYEKFNNLYTSHKAMQKNNGIKNIKFTKKAISISVAASLITAGIGYVAYKILISNFLCNKKLAIVVLVILLLCFIIFTFATPKINLFKGPINNEYGINE